MNMMYIPFIHKGSLRNILWITCPTLFVCWIIGEIVFRFFIPSSEQPLYCFDQHFRLLHFKPNTSGLATFGRLAGVRGRWCANNFGWNSVIDYEPGIGKKKALMTVIGDSYVEGFQVNVHERFPEVLQRLSGDALLVYSFGISGAPLSHYLHLNRFVNQVFDPKIVVVLVVHNDFEESLANLVHKRRFLQIEPRNGQFSEILPMPFQHSFLLRMFRRSAVFRYVENNCKLMMLVRNIVQRVALTQKPINYNANIDVNQVAKERDLVRESTQFLVGKLRAENLGRKLIILMDGPRFDIYRNNVGGSNILWLHQILHDACQENDIEFLDLTEAFSQHWEKSQQPLEHLPIDAHWNKIGHEVAAKALWQKLREVMDWRTPVD